jgi:hypothetical protein
MRNSLVLAPLPSYLELTFSPSAWPTKCTRSRFEVEATWRNYQGSAGGLLARGEPLLVQADGVALKSLHRVCGFVDELVG